MLDGIVITASPDTPPAWFTYGVPVGSLLVALAAAVLGPIVNAATARRQRNHDREQRADQFEHELRLKEADDHRNLRDARLERLRGDFATLMAMVAVQRDLARAVRDREQAPGHVAEAMASGVREFRAARARLELEPIGRQLLDAIVTIGDVSVRFLALALEQDPQSEAAEEAFEALLRACDDVATAGREALQRIEHEPLRAAAGEQAQ